MTHATQLPRRLGALRTALILSATVAALFAVPGGTLGALGTDDAHAADPRGNWYEQFKRTQARAVEACNWPPNVRRYGRCTSVNLESSGSAGPNSRRFSWSVVLSNAATYTTVACNATYVINNNYAIVRKSSTGCRVLSNA